MFTDLDVAHFKAFGTAQHVAFRPITLIFGANSAGKSSLLHSLLLAHHGLTTGEFNVTTPTLAGDTVDLGGYRRFVFRKDATLASEIGISLNNIVLESGRRLYDASTEAVRRTARVVFYISDVDPVTYLKKYELWIDGQHLVTIDPHGGLFSRINYLNTSHPIIEERLAKVRRRIFDGELTLRDLKEILEQLKDSYYDIGALRNMPGYRTHNRYSDDEFEREESEVSYASVVAAASYHDPELEEIFEELDAGFAYSPYKFIDDNTAIFPKEILESNRLTTVLALASKLENTIIREVDLHRILRQLIDAVDTEIHKLNYLGPLRTLPSRTINSQLPDSASWRATGGFAWSRVLEDSDVREKVNTWLGANYLNTKYKLSAHITPTFDSMQRFLLGIKQQFQEKTDWQKEMFEDGVLDADDLTFDAEDFIENAWNDFYRTWSADKSLNSTSQELVLTDLRTNTRVSHRDVGVGISQILPVLVHAFGSTEKIIAIEQPELHLHPALQAELGDVFIQSALGEQKNQVILETHSEHLILRLMRRIRETCDGQLPEGVPMVSPEDISILFVEPTEAGSLVRRIRLDEEGQLIDAWPGGFFEEGFRERFS